MCDCGATVPEWTGCGQVMPDDDEQLIDEAVFKCMPCLARNIPARHTRVIRRMSCSPAVDGSPPISRVLSWATIPLGPPLPTASSSLPGSDASHANAPLFGLAPDEVCRAVRVTTSAVGSYPAISPLPVLADLGGIFLLHCLSPWASCEACCARPLAGILLYGARTFLPTPIHHEHPAVAWRTSGWNCNSRPNRPRTALRPGRRGHCSRRT